MKSKLAEMFSVLALEKEQHAREILEEELIALRRDILIAEKSIQ